MKIAPVRPEETPLAMPAHPPERLVISMARFSQKAWKDLNETGQARPVILSDQGDVMATAWNSDWTDGATTLEKMLWSYRLVDKLARELADMTDRYERACAHLPQLQTGMGAEAVARCRKLVEQATV